MSRNEITLQEMFSSVIGELRESGRWGTAHIYQSTVNVFSVFAKWQPVPMRKLSPTVLKRFENYLRQRNCSWNTVSTYIKAIRSVYNRTVDRKLVRYVPILFEHVYTGTRTDRKKALEASDIGSLVRETEMNLQAGNSPNTRQKTKIFFVLMFMLRGIPFVDLAYLHKRVKDWFTIGVNAYGTRGKEELGLLKTESNNNFYTYMQATTPGICYQAPDGRYGGVNNPEDDPQSSSNNVLKMLNDVKGNRTTNNIVSRFYAPKDFPLYFPNISISSAL